MCHYTFQVEHVTEEEVPDVLYPHILFHFCLCLKCQTLLLLVELETSGVPVHILTQSIVTCLKIMNHNTAAYYWASLLHNTAAYYWASLLHNTAAYYWASLLHNTAAYYWASLLHNTAAYYWASLLHNTAAYYWASLLCYHT